MAAKVPTASTKQAPASTGPDCINCVGICLFIALARLDAANARAVANGWAALDAKKGMDDGVLRPASAYIGPTGIPANGRKIGRIDLAGLPVGLRFAIFIIAGVPWVDRAGRY